MFACITHIVLKSSTATDTYLSTCVTVFSIVSLCCAVKFVKQARVRYSTDPACDSFTDMLFCTFLRCQTVVWPLQLSLSAVWECGVWAFSICLSQSLYVYCLTHPSLSFLSLPSLCLSCLPPAPPFFLSLSHLFACLFNVIGSCLGVPV